MTVTHMSHRDGSVTPPVCHAVSHVPREAVPPTRPDPTRPDPTRPISVVGAACGCQDFSLHCIETLLTAGSCNAERTNR